MAASFTVDAALSISATVSGSFTVNAVITMNYEPVNATLAADHVSSLLDEVVSDGASSVLGAEHLSSVLGG